MNDGIDFIWLDYKTSGQGESKRWLNGATYKKNRKIFLNQGRSDVKIQL